MYNLYKYIDKYPYLLIEVIDVLLERDVRLHVAIVAVGAAAAGVEARHADVIQLAAIERVG